MLSDLGPLAQLRAGRLARRLTQLLVGLALYGVSLGLMVRGALGLAPWDVLHSGLTHYLPLDLGEVIVVMSLVVMLFWIPLREKPGLGTIANALMIGPSADLTMSMVHEPSGLTLRAMLMVGGIVLCGLATALYIGAQLGRGPRDGLMTGIARRTGWSLRTVRTGLEVAVVVLGLLCGGSIGLGTLLFAVSIGPLAQAMLPGFLVPLEPSPVVAPASAGAAPAA